MKLGNFSVLLLVTVPLPKSAKIPFFLTFLILLPKSTIFWKWSCPTSNFFHFLKILHFSFNIHFESCEAMKTHCDTLIWIYTKLRRNPSMHFSCKFIEEFLFNFVYIQISVSQWVFIASRDSKFMLKLKCNIFRKWKKFEVGQLHFQNIVLFGNNIKKVKKKGIFALFGRALLLTVGHWSCPTSKKFLF